MLHAFLQQRDHYRRAFPDAAAESVNLRVLQDLELLYPLQRHACHCVALRYAYAIYGHCLADPERIALKVEQEGAMMEALPPLDDAMDLCDLTLPSMLQNSLRRGGHRTVGDVRRAGRKALLAIPGLGAQGLAHLEAYVGPLSQKPATQAARGTLIVIWVSERDPLAKVQITAR